MTIPVVAVVSERTQIPLGYSLTQGKQANNAWQTAYRASSPRRCNYFCARRAAEGNGVLGVAEAAELVQAVVAQHDRHSLTTCFHAGTFRAIAAGWSVSAVTADFICRRGCESGCGTTHFVFSGLFLWLVDVRV